VTLRERWIGGINRIVTGGEETKKRIAPVAGTLLFTLIALFLVISVWVDRALGLDRYFSLFAGLALGIPALLAGLYLVMWATFTFAETGGTPVPVNPPPRLVTGGPYGYVRNPMLAGMFLLLFGIGFLLRSFVIVFVFSPLFVMANVAEVKAIEEPELEMRLGDEYRRYKAKTPMFIPRLWRS